MDAKTKEAELRKAGQLHALGGEKRAEEVAAMDTETLAKALADVARKHTLVAGDDFEKWLASGVTPISAAKAEALSIALGRKVRAGKTVIHFTPVRNGRGHVQYWQTSFGLQKGTKRAIGRQHSTSKKMRDDFISPVAAGGTAAISSSSAASAPAASSSASASPPLPLPLPFMCHLPPPQPPTIHLPMRGRRWRRWGTSAQGALLSTAYDGKMTVKKFHEMGGMVQHVVYMLALPTCCTTCTTVWIDCDERPPEREPTSRSSLA